MKTLKFFTIAALVLGLSTTAFAQNPDVTKSAGAGATIIQALDMTKMVDLEFGNIIASSAGGTVVIDPNSPNGNPTYTGVKAPSQVGESPSAAQFDVTGANGQQYKVTLPDPNEITLKIGEDGATMTVNTFTIDSDGITRTLDMDGKNTFYVGATLNVGASQAAGRYTGSFKVTVAYE